MTSAMDRRRFLAGGLGLGVAGVLRRPVGRISLRPRAVDLSRAGAGQIDAARRTVGTAAPMTSPAAGSLVLVTLYGGNDGLNTVVPLEEPAYLSERANIAMRPEAVLPIGEGLGLNPVLVNLKSMWDSGKLAIVRGVGYPDPSLSHFQSMDIWQTGSTAGDITTGWLGRWLDQTGTDPLRACSVGPQVLPAMVGATFKASAVQDNAWPGAQLPQADPAYMAIYRELQRPLAAAGPYAMAEAISGTEMLGTSKEFADAIAQEPPPRLPPRVDGGDVATQLGIVSQLIRAGLPTRAYGVTQGGYDTHSGEAATQSQLLGQLDATVGAFFSSLAGHPQGAATTMVIYSEFGRRVQSNASGGTDHGTANNVFVLGPSVRGGFYGEQPNLTKLDVNDNLIYNVDFRSVYATLLEHLFGVDAKPFLGASYPVLGFI